MDDLVDAAVATCPQAFGGAGGSIFLKALTALVAAHCAILPDHGWPVDNAKKFTERPAEEIAYDYIVVGAGTAGSLVASRLSRSLPELSVLLVEAGEDPGLDSEIPGLLFLNQKSTNDWSYRTESNGVSCLGFKNKSCIWSKGKGMGGSSSINAMLYIRGHPNDFDDWKNSGHADWAYDNMKYYFELQEDKFNVSNLSRTGHDGWYSVIDNAWKELQFKSYKYENHEGLVGTKKCTLLTKDGKRLNTAKLVLKEGKHLNVMKNSVVEKIILDDTLKRAKGVKIRHSSGAIMDVIARKEVILSAGAIASPQILMLSGIGPRKHLEDTGIKCYLNLPVGKNLQDHLLFPLFLKTNQHVTVTDQMMNLLILEYMLMRTGPFSNIAITDFFGFINTKNSSDHPNVQFLHLYFPKNDKFMLPSYLRSIGYKENIEEDIIRLNKQQDILGIYPALLHPKSKGEILLSDKNWNSQPVIKPNYLQHQDDMETLIEAIEFVHKLEQTDAFKAMGLELLRVNIPDCSALKFNTNSYWDCYIRHMATTLYHPIGTVKMGDDNTAVVDHKLLVHGIKNLRVVDASIMPSIPGANTMAATLAIANKAVDIIVKQYPTKNEL